MTKPETKLGQFTCQQCGKCCEELGHTLTLSSGEVRKWEAYENLVPSNFGYYYPSDFIYVFEGIGFADLWFHPVTGDELSRCPFLRRKGIKYECLIHDTGLKPDICKEFPVDSDTGELWNESCPEAKRIIEARKFKEYQAKC